ncbi:hypothetical protein FACS1894211_11500 [Clostridia bacterium]|nr:hypothetical protein FACS1894211_11500 [Clostridia bacterium]
MNIYEYQRAVGKIEDISDLRNEFIAAYDTKSHKDAVRFCLLYGRHISERTGFEPCGEIVGAFGAVQKWIDGKTSYREARNFPIWKLAREAKDPIRIKFYRTMTQIACSPHVKYHALWATDFAVTLINKMYPGNMDEVKRERGFQIELMRSMETFFR